MKFGRFNNQDINSSHGKDKVCGGSLRDIVAALNMPDFNRKPNAMFFFVCRTVYI